MEISPHELAQRLAAGEKLEVVDVREAAEFAGWRIHGSRNLPVIDALRANRTEPLVAAAADFPPDRTVVAVCRAGVLSRRAVLALNTMGRQAMSLSGGMRGWGGVWTEAQIPADEASFVTTIIDSLTAKPPNFESVIAVNEGRAELVGHDPLDLEAGPNRCAAG